MSISAERMLAETRRCSVANRLPPPWAGKPVKVPHAVKLARATRPSKRMGARRETKTGL